MMTALTHHTCPKQYPFMTAPARHKQLIIEIHMGKMYFYR
jgi:hypothetical protein